MVPIGTFELVIVAMRSGARGARSLNRGRGRSGTIWAPPRRRIGGNRPDHRCAPWPAGVSVNPGPNHAGHSADDLEMSRPETETFRKRGDRYSQSAPVYGA